MTIYEAAKTGRLFKRPKHQTYLYTINTSPYWALTREDLLATDWEVEEEKITTTRARIRGLVNKVLHDVNINSRTYNQDTLDRAINRLVCDE